MTDEELEKATQYRIRVRKSDWEVEVSSSDKDFVLVESDRLIKHLSMAMIPLPPQEIIGVDVSQQSELSHSRNRKPETLNEFIRQFKLNTHLERILVLGYWCEIKQEQSFFTIEDILTKYKEIREPPPANIRRDLGTLQGRGLLLSADKQEGAAYGLTNSGIKEVESKLLKE